MILTEYNEELHARTLVEEGRREERERMPRFFRWREKECSSTSGREREKRSSTSGGERKECPLHPPAAAAGSGIKGPDICGDDRAD